MNKLSVQIKNIIYKYTSRFLFLLCFYLLFSIFNVLPNYLVGKIVDNINKSFQMIMIYLLIRLLSIGVKTLINYFQTKLSLNIISDIKEYYFVSRETIGLLLCNWIFDYILTNESKF